MKRSEFEKLQQKIFTKSAKHLLKQGKKCYRLVENQYDYNYGCQYRHAGRMCAVGVLINDEYYNIRMEGKPAYTDNVFKAVLASFNVSKGSEEQNYSLSKLLMDLQDIHDNNDPESWRTELSNLADIYCLDMPNVK